MKSFNDFLAGIDADKIRYDVAHSIRTTMSEEERECFTPEQLRLIGKLVADISIAQIQVHLRYYHAWIRE